LQLSVVGSDGRLVMQHPWPQGVSSFSLPVSDLAPGIYYAHITTNGTWLTGGKFVVE